MTQIDVSAIVDDLTKLIGAACSVATLALVYWKALPKIDEIHTQTNGFAEKVEAGAHAQGVKEGVKEGLEQAAAAQVVTAQAIGTVVDIAADKVLAAAKLAKEG